MGFWENVPPHLTFEVEPFLPIDRILSEGVKNLAGSRVWVRSLRTVVVHNYLDVFQESKRNEIGLTQWDIAFIDNDRSELPSVNLRDLGEGKGFQLQSPSNLRRGKLPEVCRGLIVE